MNIRIYSKYHVMITETNFIQLVSIGGQQNVRVIAEN